MCLMSFFHIPQAGFAVKMCDLRVALIGGEHPPHPADGNVSHGCGRIKGFFGNGGKYLIVEKSGEAKRRSREEKKKGGEMKAAANNELNRL